MKKLVPATRSRINNTHAGRRTANAKRPMHEVMNQAHVLIGRRESVMPLVRRSSVVAMKFNEPSNCPTQKSPIDIAHKFCPQASPGPASEPTALKGAYAVQPEIGGPSGTKNAAMRMQNARNVIQNDIMLNRGKAISSAPIWMGRKQFPKAAKGAFVSTKK